MKFTPSEAEILLHRIDSGCIPEVFEEDGLMMPDLAHHTVEEVRRQLAAGGEVSTQNPAALLVLREAAEGSTFFAGLEDAVAGGQVSRGKAMAYRRAAVALEIKLGVKIPR